MINIQDMSVGIAFSGGGVPAAISAACAWNAIVETYPSIMEPSNAEKVTVSTVSGGSIGYGLWVNARDRIQFTPYHYNMTLEELQQDDAPKQTDMSMDALDYLLSSKTQTVTSCDADSKRTVGNIAADLFSPIFLKQAFTKEVGSCSHWWNCIIQGVFGLLCVEKISSGDLPWLTSFAVFDESVMFERDSVTGTLLSSSAEYLHHMIVDMNSDDFGESQGQDGCRDCTRDKMLPIDALSFSSSFWASNVLTNNMMNLLFNNMLNKGSTSQFIQSDKTKESVAVVMDGGVIDTTGIIGLLKQQKDHIIVFYNNNVPLATLASPISHLFGVNAATDSMNSLKGPELTQVFPSAFYPAVIRNLTDPSVGMARLEDLTVVENQVGVEPYRLSSLVIISNGKLHSFEFKDTRVHDQLNSKWPDQFSYGIPSLDANALCALNDYKVKNMMKQHLSPDRFR